MHGACRKTICYPHKHASRNAHRRCRPCSWRCNIASLSTSSARQHFAATQADSDTWLIHAFVIAFTILKFASSVGIRDLHVQTSVQQQQCKPPKRAGIQQHLLCAISRYHAYHRVRPAASSFVGMLWDVSQGLEVCCWLLESSQTACQQPHSRSKACKHGNR